MTQVQPQRVYQNQRGELVLAMGNATYTENTSNVVVFQDLQTKVIYVMPHGKFVDNFSVLN